MSNSVFQSVIVQLKEISDRTFDFKEGLNVICGENGWGKTTLCAFLKVMFFGFENERTRDAYENERKRFKPWQGGVYGGSVNFEADGVEYRLLRTFGLKEAEDEFVLKEVATGLDSNAFGKNIGEELFAIDAESFKRTVFFALFTLWSVISAAVPRADRLVNVDSSGVMRWMDDGGEVALLGVNYYAPFTVDYMALTNGDRAEVLVQALPYIRRYNGKVVALPDREQTHANLQHVSQEYGLRIEQSIKERIAKPTAFDLPSSADVASFAKHPIFKDYIISENDGVISLHIPLRQKALLSSVSMLAPGKELTLTLFPFSKT